ncbi:hypothetical protein lerEdw1_010411 [Lerista edwardsae]|nr:hypothetical protein lerEdw1_010411 [Lerista edwardsae]
MGVTPWTGLLLLMGHTMQPAVLPELVPPENVTLVSENCRTFLTWHPALNSTNGTQYEVERLNDNRSNWLQEASCRGNNLQQTQRCELHLSNLFTPYQARVRVQEGASLSRWVRSNKLQLYKDTVIGPLNLSLDPANGNLTVVVSMPYNAVSEKLCLLILSVLSIQINLTEEDGDKNRPITEVVKKNLTKYTFDDLKPKTTYCVHVKVLKQPAKKAVRCIVMPKSLTGDNWALFVLVSVIAIGVILLSVVVMLFFRHTLYPRHSGIDFPKSLIFLQQEPSGNCPAWRPILHVEESSIASLAAVMLPPDANTTTEPTTLPAPFIPCGYRAWGLSDYCPNGFDRGSFSSVEDTASVAGVEPFSSRGPVRGEDLQNGSYQAALGLLGSPASPRPSSPGLGESRSSSSWVLQYKTVGEARLPSLFTAAVPLDSLKLQAVIGAHSPMCNPRAYVVTQDDGAQAPMHKATESQGERDEMEMPCQILGYAVMVLLTASGMEAYPVYPDMEGMQDFVPTDFNLVDSTGGFIPDEPSSNVLRQPRNWSPALSALEEGINQIQKAGRWNGGKEVLQDDAPDNLVEDVKAVLWKLAAADKLRSQAFVKADQAPQKPSKRACFWKYCVTN